MTYLNIKPTPICFVDSEMQGIFIPLMLDNEAAMNVTKDFREDFNKFMATLTESIYEAKGQTLLYIPPLEFVGTVKEQARDKELTQRLEQVVIRWTRQIKEVCNIVHLRYTRNLHFILVFKNLKIYSI